MPFSNPFEKGAYLMLNRMEMEWSAEQTIAAARMFTLELY